VYILLVLLQTVGLPLLSGTIQFSIFGGDPLLVYGIWWAFWGVGTRLLVAGISQLANPARTAKGILGIDDPAAEQVVHELAFANLSLGVAAMATAFIPGGGILGAAAGALYLGLAGLRHVTKRGKGADENVATITDLIVFVMVALGLVGWAIS
jgi:hypothetical protein